MKIKLYSYLGSLANIYIRVKYFFTYVFLGDKKKRMNPESDIIVSLTTFPARIDTVHLTICSLLEQSVKPAKLILWLADTQFPSTESLPDSLLRLEDYGLEIRFCDDLKSHKKYFYTCKEYPSSIIITVDDDAIYPRNTIQKLVEKSKSYPNCVCCNRGHEITFTGQKVDEYKKWIKEATYLKTPTTVLCPTGIGGVLYPPGSLYHDFLNKERIIKCAITADDLWLKYMELLQGTKSVYTDGFPQWLFLVSGSQNVTLAKTNVNGNQNDRVLNCITEAYRVELYELCHKEEFLINGFF